jgi:cytochrome b
MSIQQETMVVAADAMPAAAVKGRAKSIRVWDLFVRIFHWSLVGLFVAAFATGDEIEWLHIVVGYVIAALITLRIVWGFVGPRYARFSDFVRSPRVIVAYLVQAAQWKAPRYLGHNPAGGAMIIALLANSIDHSMLDRPRIEQFHYPERTGFPA